MGRQLFPEFRDANATTHYPFADGASLGNGRQQLLEDTFLDAQLYVIGGGANLFLSGAVVTHDTVTITIGDQDDPALASGSFSLFTPPDVFKLLDPHGRPAGVIVSESARLALLGGWGVGTLRFDGPEQTGFAATVCIPTPQIGVRGLALPDGTVMTGDVWLVGDDGVVLRPETVTVPAGCGQSITYETIRVDVVGDPLFRRRLCTPRDLFATPPFIRQITFQDAHQLVRCKPNQYGDLKMTVNNATAAQPVLRIRPTPAGNVIEVVGTVLQSVR